MNYVVVAVYAGVATALMGMFAILWYAEGHDREVVEAKLRTERDDALLQCEKLKPERDDALKLYAMLSREHAELVAHNADLLDALTDAQREIKALHMQTVEVPEVKPVPKRPARTKKAISE